MIRGLWASSSTDHYDDKLITGEIIFFKKGLGKQFAGIN